MKTRLTTMASLAALLAAGAGAGEYALVWSDEFDRDGPPDPANWGYETGFERNEELQWYQPENAVCRDGHLIIEARRERKPNPDYLPGSRSWRRSREFIDYTSACLITRDKQSWQYGRFEIRARIVAADGLWPAIWFLGVGGRWPFNGEIDLMEYYDGSILANACWGGEQRGQPAWDTAKLPLATFGGPDWDDDFHVWRMDWDENRIALSLDDRILNTIDLNQTLNPPGYGLPNPFHQPHYLLLNLAIGGIRGGDPSHTPFPTRFEIDYVRVYQPLPHPLSPDG